MAIGVLEEEKYHGYETAKYLWLSIRLHSA